MFLNQQENGTVAEDCLFLNVYAPRSSFGRSTRLPVVMYIHGGAYIFGSGSSKWLNPHMYTKHDVILVSINYRLNLLGFISLPNLPYTNFGLLDQRVAMEWVHENIEAFGGDPSQLTLIGDSAGAISILHHLTSTLHVKKPLFNRGILISPGLFAGPELTMEKAHPQYLKLAAQLGCSGPPSQVLDCLLKLPATSVRVPTSRFPSPFVTTYPMAGRETGYPINDRTFFPDLIDALQRGKYDKTIPLIVGSDRDEGTMFAAAAFPIVYPSEALFSTIVSNLFGDKAPKVMARYGPAATGSVRKSVNELTSHMFTSHGTCQIARLISLSSHAPIHRYGNYHLFHNPSNEKMGVFHTAAHGLFLRPNLTGMIFPTVFSDAEIEMSDRFGKMLMTFARGEPLSEAEWPAFTSKTHLELHIGPENSTRLKVGSGFQKEDCDFWAQLYPPNGLHIPIFYGDLYEHEELVAWIANHGFWWLAVRWRFVTSSALFAAIAIALLVCYRFSPLRSKKKTTTNPTQQTRPKVKKE